MSRLEVIQGDSAVKLLDVESDSIHCCVTSPPYDKLRTYGGFEFDFESIAKQLYRVLCDGGVVCWNVGDATINGSETLTSFKQAMFFVEQCGFRLHDTMIWHKPNFSNPSSNRYHQLFEYVFILSKGAPRVFNPIMDKPNKYPNGPWGKNTFRKPTGEMEVRPFKPAREFGMRGNVWSGNTVGQENAGRNTDHPAMMPKWLARDLIISWSSMGDTVLDPFAGSGTTGSEALKLNRKAVLIELNEGYIPIIEKRCQQEGDLFNANELLAQQTK